MLGAVAATSNGWDLLEPVRTRLLGHSQVFQKNSKGKWRFFTDAGEVDTSEEQRSLFLLRSSGKVGSWDPDSRSHAKSWAASMASVFEQAEAITVQRTYTTKRLFQFATEYAKELIGRAPPTNVGKAFTAGYLSFAANNPTWAAKYLKKAVDSSAHPQFSLPWLVDVLKSLTHGPGVQIYPHRYNAIRPVLERLYAIDLPDTAALLENEKVLEESLSPTEIQTILLELGYDLGPYGPNEDGIDGVITFGGATWQATSDFQRRHMLGDDGWVGTDTAVALRAAAAALEEHRKEAVDMATRRQVLALVNLTVQQSVNEYFATARSGGNIGAV
jgi:peptidoglycan hydrolase-like protein with peptidoglycan-binding domain